MKLDSWPKPITQMDPRPVPAKSPVFSATLGCTSAVYIDLSILAHQDSPRMAH